MKGMASKKPARKGYRFDLTTRTESEIAYLADLEKTFEKSPFSVMERLTNFALYVPRQNLTTLLVKYEIFSRILGVQGSVIECGVCFGGGLMSFAQLSAILEPTNYQRQIIGFDTFSGFPRLSGKDARALSKDAHAGGLAVDSHEEVSRCVALYDRNRFVGHIPKVELVKGDATQTIPKYLERNPHLVVSLLYLDFDVYEPTRVALELLRPRMPKGAVIGFDELNLKNWPGETMAVVETLGLSSLRIERCPFGSTISFAQLT